MKHLAVMMRYELEQGDVDAFARLLNEHWEVSKKLDAGSTIPVLIRFLQAVRI